MCARPASPAASRTRSCPCWRSCFEPTDAPSGNVVLTFSGGAGVRSTSNASKRRCATSVRAGHAEANRAILPMRRRASACKSRRAFNISRELERNAAAARPVRCAISASASPSSRRRSGKFRKTSTPRCATSSPTCAARGDAALIDYSQRFDRVDLRTLGLAVAPDEIARAEAECDPRGLGRARTCACAHSRLSREAAAAGSALHR